MNEKDRLYWEGIAKAKSELPPKTKSLEKVLQWLPTPSFISLTFWRPTEFPMLSLED